VSFEEARLSRAPLSGQYSMRRTSSPLQRTGLALAALLAIAGPASAQPVSLPVVTVLVDNAKLFRLP
jgi:hypothetical protein